MKSYGEKFDDLKDLLEQQVQEDKYFDEMDMRIVLADYQVWSKYHWI